MVVVGYNYPLFRGTEDTALSAGKKEIIVETEKTEITNLPEGMSSEELDKMTTEGEEPDDAGLAEEALAATEESSPAEESVKTDETAAEEPEEAETPKAETKPEEEPKEKPEADPKDAVIGDFRRKLRDSELETAKLQGRLEAKAEAETKTKEPEKSPLDIAEEAWLADPDNDGSLDGFSMDGELYRKQRAFDKAADTKVAATDKEEQSTAAMDKSVKSLQAGDLSVEKVGDGLDFKTVVGLGQNYLDKADLLKIEIVSRRDGIDAGLRKAYELCKQVILDADNEDSKLLQNAINIKAGKKKESQTKPKLKGKPDIDALTTEGVETEKGEAETETHSKKLTDFIFEPE